MSLFLTLLSFLFLSTGRISASDVVVGTPENFHETIKEGVIMVEFYAPWCTHCKKLEPEWESAATELKGQATFMKFDATTDESLARGYGVKGFPTIKVFVDGEVGDYEGERTAKALVAFAKRRLSSPVVEISDAEALAAFKADNVVGIVLYTSPNSDVFKSFDRNAKALRETVPFAVVYDSVLLGEYTLDSIVMFKRFEENESRFEGDIADRKAFEKWVLVEAFPLLGEIGPDNYRNYVKRGFPLAWLFVDPSVEDATLEVQKLVRGVASKYKGALSFVYLPIQDGNYLQMVRRFGLTGDKYPVFAIDAAENKYFAYSEDQDISAEALEEFCSKFVNGSLERTVKSEAVPEVAEVDGLTTVVGKTFLSVVKNTTNDVLLVLHAPWCGHCKHLAPTYGSLASALRDVPTITVAQMDATTNDPSEDFDVQGFPSIFFIPAGKEKMMYEGERSASAMLAYVKEHATHHIDVDESAVGQPSEGQ